MRFSIVRIIFLALVILLGYAILRRLGEEPTDRGPVRAADLPIPVEVAPVERGTIELERTLSGTLEASEEFVVVPRVDGRIIRLPVDIGDPVENGQLVAELKAEEFQQSLAQAEANLAVARANRVEAENTLEIAKRALDRMEELRERGVSSESEEDVARAELLVREAAVEIAKAAITRAEAAVETARIRLSYTRITASWSGDDGPRYVAERYVDEGDTVSPSSRLLSIVDLDPLTAVVYVTERDYALLEPGQVATLTTDVYPGERFSGRVRRIAPVFRAASRQARVELAVENIDRRLRPGIFVLAEVRLDRADDAFIVPVEALATLDGRNGVFVVSADGETVAFRAAEPGIRHRDRVELLGALLAEPLPRVVTIGHELLADGARIHIADELPRRGSPLPGRRNPKAPAR